MLYWPPVVSFGYLRILQTVHPLLFDWNRAKEIMLPEQCYSIYCVAPIVAMILCMVTPYLLCAPLQRTHTLAHTPMTAVCVCVCRQRWMNLTVHMLHRPSSYTPLPPSSLVVSSISHPANAAYSHSKCSLSNKLFFFFFFWGTLFLRKLYFKNFSINCNEFPLCSEI